MIIDFSDVAAGRLKLSDLAARIDLDQLRAATDASIDRMLQLLQDLVDADVVFEPEDPEANDPYAIDGEETIGWNIAHLILHTTASSEEGAAFSSLLARGIDAVENRLRYEPYWRNVTTVQACIDRLEESRRMRHAYLNTWPDEPHLDVYRKISARRQMRTGPLNAVGAYLSALKHEYGHWPQLLEVKRQALEARREPAAAL